MRNIKTKQELDDIHATTRFQEFFFPFQKTKAWKLFVLPLLIQLISITLLKKKKSFIQEAKTEEEGK